MAILLEILFNSINSSLVLGPRLSRRMGKNLALNERPIVIFSLTVLSVVLCLQTQTPQAGAINDYNFVAAGDWGCTSNTDATVNNMVGKSPERVLGLGDYSYASTATCWFNKIAPLDSITKIAIGNHEDDSSEGFDSYMSHFGLTKAYYSFNYQNTHLLVIDTDRDSYSSGSSQYNFVKSDLQSAAQDPSIDWIIVYLHKFMYTSPSEESAFTSLRDTYHPLFVQYGVDLVLQGHQHNYQRTFPIKYNNNNPSDPIKASTNLNDYPDTDGQLFAIVGTGGQNFDVFSGKATFVTSQQNTKFGFLDVKITGGGSKLEGKYYTNDGALFDQFSITKENSAPVAYNQIVSVNKDISKSITLNASDIDNNPLSYTIVTAPSHGTISSGSGTIRTYTPASGYVGTDSFTFKANDGTIDSNIATVNINVQSAQQGGGYNYAPGLVLSGSNYYNVADSSTFRLSQFSIGAWFKTASNFGSDALIVNKGGLGSDSSGQNMNYGIWMTSSERIMAGFETSSGSDQYVTSPNAYNDDKWHYAVVTYGGSTVILYIDGVQIGTKSTSGASPETSGTKPIRVGANSRITPPGNFFVGQIDEVRVWNDDLTAQQAASAFAGTDFTVGKQVLHLPFGTNSPPVANNQAVNVIKDTQAPVTLTATDPDNNPLTYSIVVQALHGTVAPTGPGTASRTYSPNAGYLGSDSFTFKVNDGTVDSNVATVSLNVKLSDPPVANNQNVDVIKNTAKSITLTATDPDTPTLTYSIVIPTENGTLSGTTPNLMYNPDANFIGTDSFTFKANDGTTDSNIAVVSITIQNSQPVASAQSVTVNKNTAKSITLAATDPNNDPLTYAIVTPPLHGALSPSGTGGSSRTYTPTTDYVGPDSFTFKANDGTIDSNVATVSITVAATQQGGYNYAPSLVLTGTNYHDEPDSANLRLTQFTVASWFKTSTNFASEAFIVNKGGIGSDSAGQNQNYQISMTSTEQIKVGFETSIGADQFLTSPLAYSDGKWHYAVVTNDGSTLTLYIDGAAVTSKSVAGSSPENTGTKPVRVGANSRVTPSTNFFTGEVDEVRIWNDDLTASQVSAAFAGTSFNTATQKLYLDFGTSMATGYQYGPSLSLTGP